MENFSFVGSINYVVILFFLCFILFIVIGFYVYLKDSKSKQNLIFLFWNIAFSIGCIGYLFIFWTNNENDVYFFSKIAAIGYCLIWPIAINFLVLFLKGKINKTWIVYIVFLYVIGVFYIIAAFTGISASKAYTLESYGWVDQPNESVLYPIYVIYIVVCTLTVIILISLIKVRSYKSGNYNKKKQANIMLNMAIPSIFFGLFFNIFVPMFKLHLPSIGFVFSGIWIFGIAYASVKYKLSVNISNYAGLAMFELNGNININTDPNLNIVEVNNSFCEELKYKKDEVIGLCFNDIVKNSSDFVICDEIYKNQYLDKDIVILTKHKTAINVNLKACSVYDNNNLVGVYFSLTNITILKNQNEILEQKVAEKTKEIKNQLEITEVFAGATVAEMTRNGVDPRNMIPEEKDMAILFSDIRSFTSISEKLSPQEVISLLNNYFEYVGGSIEFCDDHDNDLCKGEINKFIGDGIMAVFPNSDLAINSSCLMMKRLKDFNNDFGLNINIGIGINFGPVVYGNVGKKNRMERTVLGDSVNLASRLEERTKSYGLPILISGEVKNNLKKKHSLRFIDEIFVKGKKKSTQIYEVMNYRDNRFINTINNIQRFYDQAYDLYFEGKFQDSLSLYLKIKSKLNSIGINDPVVDMYIQRCQDLNVKKFSGFLENWNGIFVLSEK